MNMSLAGSAASVNAPRRAARLAFLLALSVLALSAFAPAQAAWAHKSLHARYGHSTVYDSSNHRLIVFGGQHTKNFPNEFDSWWLVYTPGSTELKWTPITPTGGHPSARFGHSAVYDEANTRMVVFGGGTGTNGTPGPCQSDLWLMQNANGISANPAWSLQHPTGTAPTARFAHTAVYDPGSNTMMVFGGYDCTSTYFSDVWLLSNANSIGGTPAWTKLTTSGAAPSGREAASAVYDAANNIMIVFGGDNGTTWKNDVYVLSHANGAGGTATWTKLSPTGTLPNVRSGHSAIYDPGSNRMTIYAGAKSTNVTSGLLNDFWVLTNANGQGGTPSWIQLTPDITGASRSSHTANYDASTNSMLIFGGKTPVALLPADDHVTILSDANGVQ